MLILYELLLAIYVICYMPILFIKGKWHSGFLERFSFFSEAIKKRIDHPKNIWIHAVSVGEVIAIAELIRRLKAKYPGYQIVLSTSTKTGHQLALEKFSDKAVVLWSPLDFRWAVSSFIRLIKPKIYVVAETELWPNLFDRLYAGHVPILLINGRISDNSYGRYLKIRWLLKRYLGYVSALCMQSELDVTRILAIGAPQDKVKNIGNVKFDDLPEDKVYLPEDFGFEQNDSLWIAGSTHPGEEQIVLRVFKNIKTNFPSLRLVIAPRHVERAADVERIIEEEGMSFVRFSQMKSAKKNPNSVVIVDTIGHLRALYSLATLVFVGKSLTVQGGHNIIEPAFFSKPVIVGPHMQNFRDVMLAFKNDNAVVEVQDAQGLESAVLRLVSHPEQMAELGKKARQVIFRQEGAIKRSMEIISHFLDKAL